MSLYTPTAYCLHSISSSQPSQQHPKSSTRSQILPVRPSDERDHLGCLERDVAQNSRERVVVVVDEYAALEGANRHVQLVALPSHRRGAISKTQRGMYCSMPEKVLHGELGSGNRIGGLELRQIGVDRSLVPVHLVLGNQLADSRSRERLCQRSEHSSGQISRWCRGGAKVLNLIRTISTSILCVAFTSDVKDPFCSSSQILQQR